MALTVTWQLEWENTTLIDGSITKDSKLSKVETGKQAEWLIRYSDNFAIGYENAAVDGVGVGVGVIDGGEPRGVCVFKSGFAPDPFLTFGDRQRAERTSVHRS